MPKTIYALLVGINDYQSPVPKLNGCVPDGGTELYRHSKFYDNIGEDYIAKAFEYAHRADPDALLFYNDYNTENPVKRERIYQIVKNLKEKGSMKISFKTLFILDYACKTRISKFSPSFE